jgi:hypothetical protein
MPLCCRRAWTTLRVAHMPPTSKYDDDHLSNHPDLHH